MLISLLVATPALELRPALFAVGVALVVMAVIRWRGRASR